MNSFEDVNIDIWRLIFKQDLLQKLSNCMPNCLSITMIRCQSTKYANQNVKHEI